jgi:hypothetical protein
MHDAADRLAISSLLAFAEIDANERHGPSPYGLGFRSLKRGLRTKIVLTFDLSPGSDARQHTASRPSHGPLGVQRKKRWSLSKNRNVCYALFQSPDRTGACSVVLRGEDVR